MGDAQAVDEDAVIARQILEHEDVVRRSPAVLLVVCYACDCPRLPGGGASALGFAPGPVGRSVGGTVAPMFLEQAGVLARDVALGQPDGVPVLAADRVLVARQGYDGPLALVVLDDQFPHGGV